MAEAFPAPGQQAQQHVTSMSSGGSKQDTWDAFNDAGLVVLMCLKLEAILSVLLSKFCEAKALNLAYHYFHLYSNGRVVSNTCDLEDFRNEDSSAIIKNYCKITLEKLILEVFDPSPDIKKKWGTPATHFGLSDNEKSSLDEINALRDKIVHYGENTDVDTVLGHLTKDERKNIIQHYKFIVEQSEIFKKAYPQDTEQVRQLLEHCIHAYISINSDI